MLRRGNTYDACGGSNRPSICASYDLKLALPSGKYLSTVVLTSSRSTVSSSSLKSVTQLIFVIKPLQYRFKHSKQHFAHFFCNYYLTLKFEHSTNHVFIILFLKLFFQFTCCGDVQLIFQVQNKLCELSPELCFPPLHPHMLYEYLTPALEKLAVTIPSTY
ncbi:hypothetical protein CcaCcLH18_05234 [Colletotrichum camelliae]|nr:hypothetical protein CcaCcLH18_05234 [Colletotrichum camelliae]